NGIDDYEYIEGLGNLDVCNGHFGPTPDFPDGIYHYHSTMLNGEGDMGFPYFLICYHGEVDLADGGADCSGFGETWGPGIGPPPEGCEGGSSGQLEDVQLVSPVTVYSTTWLWLWLGMLAMLAVRWRLGGKA
ncbi:MAG: YHYH protein, partial [Euryarchaeota archaeon]|nr:YHYH protein [Euryarchaeota archaeon]